MFMFMSFSGLSDLVWGMFGRPYQRIRLTYEKLLTNDIPDKMQINHPFSIWSPIIAKLFTRDDNVIFWNGKLFFKVDLYNLQNSFPN